MQVSQCRLCQGQLSEPKLKLPSTPLANDFLPTIQEQELFPLEVCRCDRCFHYQLNESIDPSRLFRHYTFVAGTSSQNIEHFRQYAVHMVDKFQLPKGSKILDIASNDGTLLQQFKDVGMSILGIDPALNIAEEATQKGIPTLPQFFTDDYATIMKREGYSFDLITANNVFAHIPSLVDFAVGVQQILAPKGIFVFEVSYFIDVCDYILFDTIYHEHSSYHTIEPLIILFKSCQLEVFDVEFINTHGGSIRVFVRHQTDTDYILPNLLLLRENHIEEKVELLSKKIQDLGQQLRTKLQQFQKEGKSIDIYGAPAKSTTLLYALNIDEKMIGCIYEDAPLKQHTFSPGKHIPILPSSDIYNRKPDVILILAWNFAGSIMKMHPNFKGRWIVPIPEIKEY